MRYTTIWDCGQFVRFCGSVAFGTFYAPDWIRKEMAMKAKWRSIIGLTLVSVVPVSAQVQEVCYRSTDCPGAQACVETRCAAPDVPLEPCESDDGCEERYEVCHDGFCKKSGVYCENRAGYCRGDSTLLTCECENGNGSGIGVDVDNNGEPPEGAAWTDAELWDMCLSRLVSSCGEEAPDITEDCTEELLSRCEAYYDKLNDLNEACGEAAIEPTYIRLAKCCRRIDEEDEEFLAKLACVTDLALEGCSELEGCDEESGANGGADGDADDEDGDAPRGDDGKNEGADDAAGSKADAESGEDAGGCSVVHLAAGAPGNPLGLLLILLAAREVDIFQAQAIPICKCSGSWRPPLQGGVPHSWTPGDLLCIVYH